MNKEIITVAINGDSGDGVQLLGQLFSSDIARSGVFIKTEPNFPAEIRAPHGTQAGISGFKISVADSEHFTLEKDLDVLVSFNPAGLAKAMTHLKSGGLLIINTDQFSEKDYEKAELQPDILQEFQKTKQFQLLEIPITTITVNALKEYDIPHSKIKQCKNMFVLGLALYLFDRNYDTAKIWLKEKLKNKPEMCEANLTALKAGYHYLEVQEFQLAKFAVQHHEQEPGFYRQLNGNQALALGAISLVTQLERPILFAGYPITPASTLLHEMQAYANEGVHVIQAEDEIAACGIALGGSYAGSLGMTCTSGPGLDLKMEMIGLAVMTELPLVIIDVQRAGPSTGLPTRTEQSDLLQAIHGRHGESPCVVIAAHSAVDCFTRIRQAFEIALNFSVPVILLSDASIANSIEVWSVPSKLPEMSIKQGIKGELKPFARNPETHARVLFDLGRQEVIQTMGGLEKDPETGHVSYTDISHRRMTSIRKEKVTKVAEYFKCYHLLGTPEPNILIITWGSSFTVSEAAYMELKDQGLDVSLLRLDILFPITDEITPIIKQAQHVFVVELNDGQLCELLRSKFLVDAQPINQISGESFEKNDLQRSILNALEKGAQHGQE